MSANVTTATLARRVRTARANLAASAAWTPGRATAEAIRAARQGFELDLARAVADLADRRAS